MDRSAKISKILLDGRANQIDAVIDKRPQEAVTIAKNLMDVDYAPDTIALFFLTALRAQARTGQMFIGSDWQNVIAKASQELFFSPTFMTLSVACKIASGGKLDESDFSTIERACKMGYEDASVILADVMPLCDEANRTRLKAVLSDSKTMTRTAASRPSARGLAACIDAIKVYLYDHGDHMEARVKEMAGYLPSRHQVVREMNDDQLALLTDTVGWIWRKITGSKLPSGEDIARNTDAEDLDGCYWLLPGGVMVSGPNHYAAAKSHRNMVCSLLGINPLVFERALNSKSADDLLLLVLSAGGVRMLVNRRESSVHMQTSEDSWVWAKHKLSRMWHKRKVIKIVDLRSPYRGWKSGVPVSL